MILSPLPNNGITNWCVFTPSQDATTTRGWQTWIKPLGASWIYIIAVGSGGAGGGGQSTAGAARTGGGGGGSGGVQRILVPAFVLPDLLYVRPASGPAGGAAGVDGTAGVATFVGPQIEDTSAAFMIASVNAGGLGTAAGAAGSAASANSASYQSFALLINGSGQAGSTGGANTGVAGTGLVLPTGLLVSGGTGGAGSSTGNNVFAGGAINAKIPVTGVAIYNGLAGGVAGVSGSAAGGNGQPGLNHSLDIAQQLSRSVPLAFSGGTGGGSAGASNGGAGGPGAWGCGGGGGGAGATGGAGGRGGDGFVIIGAF